MTFPTANIRVVEDPNPESEYFELGLVIDLGNGLEVKTLLPPTLIDEISAKGGGYFIAMEADGTALICTESGPVPGIVVGSEAEPPDSFADLVSGYLDAAVFHDNLFKTRDHVRRLRDTLMQGLEEADKALDKPWADDYLDEWKNAEAEKYRIK